MSREIRISIDDDEVFERMKARKRMLDLSWEEVLHRGLRRVPGEQSSKQRLREMHPHSKRSTPHRSRERTPPDPINSPGAFAEDLKRQIQGQVRNSLRASLDADQWYDDDYESDEDDYDDYDAYDSYHDDRLESLTSAEDAVLVFDFLGDDADDPGNRVPLRVRLDTSASGLNVEVVTVRQGKSVADLNAFDRGVRQRIAAGLATGERATLEIESGVEEYRVAPVLGWRRDAEGRPTVDDVAIDEVLFDAE